VDILLCTALAGVFLDPALSLCYFELHAAFGSVILFLNILRVTLYHS
jgi:hypothetical protein